MKVLVTGAAGFVGFHLVQRLLARGDEVVGLDNLSDYYSVALKEARLARIPAGRFRFVRMDLADRTALPALFAAERFDAVVNLAAQAGVRYSVENPWAYVLPSCPAWLQDPAAMRVMIFMDWCHGKWERKRNLEGT